MKQIIELLGVPNNKWPKHRGHLKNKDRFYLVAFYVVNKVPRDIIHNLGASPTIYLRDKNAKKHWARLITDLHDKPALRNKYTAYSLEHKGACTLNGNPLHTTVSPTSNLGRIVIRHVL